jgi:DNA ligase (NAD+)
MDRVRELEELIKYHKSLYYQGRPKIPDHAYDQLENELKKLDPVNYALDIVGSASKGLNKVKHNRKMLSLNKTYKVDELLTWMGENEVTSTFKIDGVSCSLLFDEGKLIQGKTRGDGSQGEDITDKVKWIASIPKTILEKKKVEIRGEIFCPEEEFYNLSNEMEEIGLEKPNSQRNIVAGLIGRKDNIELCRYICFQAFDLIEEKESFKTELEKSHKLQSLGLEIPVVIEHKNEKSILKRIDETKEFMSEGDYQIDGLVFSYNDLRLHDELGETAHHPRYKMAFKFQGESKETRIKKIMWQVSRNGILTPVASVEPIELAGAKISRVTLHNYGVVKQNSLKRNDIIEIIRSGEVIPKFLSVKESSTEDFLIPENCPGCNMPVKEIDIRLLCENDLCPDKIRESILNFIKKIGIDDISTKRLDEMIESGLIKNIEDLYVVTEDDFLKLDKVKEKLAKKFMGSIEKSKQADLATFLSALGIQGGAYNKCEKIVLSGYKSIDKILNLEIEELIKVDSFAEKSATEFLKSLKKKKKIIVKLLESGFSFEEKEQIESEISNKKICITGSLSIKRAEMEKKIRDHGGILVSSVSKNTDILLSNEVNSGSSKFKKAISLEIPIISEVDFLKLLD